VRVGSIVAIAFPQTFNSKKEINKKWKKVENALK